MQEKTPDEPKAEDENAPVPVARDTTDWVSYSGSMKMPKGDYDRMQNRRISKAIADGIEEGQSRAKQDNFARLLGVAGLLLAVIGLFWQQSTSTAALRKEELKTLRIACRAASLVSIDHIFHIRKIKRDDYLPELESKLSDLGISPKVSEALRSTTASYVQTTRADSSSELSGYILIADELRALIFEKHGTMVANVFYVKYVYDLMQMLSSIERGSPYYPKDILDWLNSARSSLGVNVDPVLRLDSDQLEAASLRFDHEVYASKTIGREGRLDPFPFETMTEPTIFQRVRDREKKKAK